MLLHLFLFLLLGFRFAEQTKAQSSFEYVALGA